MRVDPATIAITVHHTAGSNTYTPAEAPGIIRGMQAYHQSLEWCDIGYNFLVDKYGVVYEGAAGGIDLPVHGAHAEDWNLQTVGIAFMMNSETAQPSDVSVTAVERLIGWKLQNNYRNPTGTVSIAGKTLPTIFRHIDVLATACPGRYISARMDEIRAAVAALMASATPSPIRPVWEALGGATGALGQPHRLEQPIGEGRYTQFAKGSIYFSDASGAHPVSGAIATAYAQAGGPTGAWGFPTGEPAPGPDGQVQQWFQNGWATVTDAGVVWQPAQPGIHSVAVTGTALAEQTLTAAVVRYPLDTALAFQWYRDGVALPGATEDSHTVAWEDMCAALTVQVSAAGPPLGAAAATSQAVVPRFTDVQVDHTFYRSICWAATHQVTRGSGDGSAYAPSRPVNRGSMAQFLYRLAGEPTWQAPAVSPFADVQTTDTFYAAITWLYDQRITVGVVVGGQLYYQPANAVNRGSMSAFLRRLAGSPPWTPPAVSPFADVTAATSQFYGPITWLADQRITVGTAHNGQLLYQPNNPVNRGSMSAFLSRLATTRLPCATYPGAVGC
jgi:hypothetical protein